MDFQKISPTSVNKFLEGKWLSRPSRPVSRNAVWGVQGWDLGRGRPHYKNIL